MARSLEIDREEIQVGIEGSENSPIYIGVTVDGDKTNSSFTVSAFNDYWFTYSIDRVQSNVYVVVNIKKNFTTQERYGSITIKHNCANISKTIEISQSAVEYEVQNKTTHYHSFMSVPRINRDDENSELLKYEEFRVNLEALNGRRKWYVKDIKQYQVSQNDNFDDSTYIDNVDQDAEMIQTQTTYDNVFNYTIDGNDLVVRSYGQIDLTNAIKGNGKPHMRYFFIISHSDVNNSNKIPMDEKEYYKDQTKRYEDKILFVFDGKTGSGYTEDDNPAIDPVTPPSEVTTYIFLVNGSSNQQTFNFGSEGAQNNLTVTSTKTSSEGTNNVGYDIINTLDWCTTSDGKLTVTKNGGNDSRQGSITFKQDESNKQITLLVAQDGAVKTYEFKLNDSTENRTVKIEEASVFTVVSNYGGNATPFTITNLSSAKWMTYTVSNNLYTFKAEENTSYDKREANFVFTQTNSGKTIYLTLTQEGKAETNEFNAQFDDTEEPYKKTIKYNIQTLNIKVVSTKNGVFVPYEYKVEYYNSSSGKWVTDENGWLFYSDTQKYIQVGEYDYDDVRNNNDGEAKGYTTTARITFSRDGLDKQELILTQKRQELEVEMKVSDTLTVGWEGKYYEEPYGMVYSFKTSNGVKSPVEISKAEVVSGDFIVADKIQISSVKQDNDGYYYQVTIEVTENEKEEIRTGVIRFTNSYGKTCKLNVEQRKNGEVVLTSFDYIVMNYNWTDYVKDGYVYSRDFDCVMYFDTPSIGNMYQKCAYFGNKLINDKNSSEETVTYGELAYDQMSSRTGDIDRIETQCVYLLKLKDDGYLQKIKESDERYLTIQLYGNLYRKSGAEATPIDLRTTKLSIHTYLGGTMSKDDATQTMVNTGGTEVNVGSIKDVTYDMVKYSYSTGGSNVETVTSNFQHLGTLQYNVKDKTAVFSPAKLDD